MEKGQYMCALNADQEVWEATERFNTRIEAINAGIQGLAEKDEGILGEIPEIGTTKFAVGRISEYKINFENVAEEIMEIISEDAYDYLGESATNYLEDVEGDQKKRFASVIEKFFEEEKLMPKCFNIVDIEEYDITDLFGSYVKNDTFPDFVKKEWRSGFDEDMD